MTPLSYTLAETQISVSSDIKDDATILGDGLRNLATAFDVDLSDLIHLPGSLQK
jgi:hypothetical protein